MHVPQHDRQDGVGKHEKVRDLGLGVEIDMRVSLSNAAADPSETSPCVWKICRLASKLQSHNIMGIVKGVVGHGPMVLVIIVGRFCCWLLSETNMESIKGANGAKGGAKGAINGVKLRWGAKSFESFSNFLTN